MSASVKQSIEMEDVQDMSDQEHQHNKRFLALRDEIHNKKKEMHGKNKEILDRENQILDLEMDILNLERELEIEDQNLFQVSNSEFKGPEERLKPVSSDDTKASKTADDEKSAYVSETDEQIYKDLIRLWEINSPQIDFRQSEVIEKLHAAYKAVHSTQLDRNFIRILAHQLHGTDKTPSANVFWWYGIERGRYSNSGN